jgi:glutamyl-tRNA synthetase
LFTEVRVRFAPSPTGYLHIGGVRTALYNYLFAKHNKGKFILRIEDTDVERSDEAYTEVIIRGMKWIGLDWDEGPFFQSQRIDLYKSAADKLMKSGKVYRCYCTADELKARREAAMKAGAPMGYDGKCRNLTPEQEEAFKKEGLGYVYRLRTPDEGIIAFDDIVKGRIEIDAKTLTDFVVVKSNGMPLYNFACVVDDADLKISHIIRGDDHISNTPKQILIYQALGLDVPEFAHLPQVHGADGKKLSKRTGAVSLEEYKNMGYLPEALRNFLALLGWSTEDSQQLFGHEELIEKFDLSRCGSASGIFDVEKLNWMNGKYIRDLSPEELVERALPWLKESGLVKEEEPISPKIEEAVKAEREKINFLTDIPKRIDFIVKDDIKYDEKSVRKRLKKDGVRRILTDILEIFEKISDFTTPALEEEIKKYCEANEVGAGKVFHPVRVAVSGRMEGPGVFELLELVGRDKVLKRIKYALDNLVEGE